MVTKIRSIRLLRLLLCISATKVALIKIRFEDFSHGLSFGEGPGVRSQ
jgi:hypothetical protein